MALTAKNLHIISRGIDIFRNREEAGRFLGKELKRLDINGDVVLGIPRGGIVIAREIAEELHIETDIVLSRKLSAPGNPELAIGAVSEDGKEFINKRSLTYTKASKIYVQAEKERQMAVIKRRGEKYREVRPKVSLEGKTVIITDDGVATGATFQAALWAAGQEKPAALVAAIPVGAEESIEKLATTADEVICLSTPPHFYAIGQFYKEFAQVDDSEVLNILRRENHERI